MLARKYFDGVEILYIKVDEIKEELKKIASQIKKEYPNVKRIILFGSFAKANFTPYSDIDIAIILDKANKKFLERQDDFIEFFIHLPLDTNLVVYTTKEIDRMSEDGNNFITEVLKGIEL